MDQATKAQLIEAYKAASPDVISSPAITQRLAEQHGVKVASVRSVLVAAGVYIAQAKPRGAVHVNDEEALVEVYNASNRPQRRDHAWVSEVAKRFNYQPSAITSFFQTLDEERRTVAANRVAQERLNNPPTSPATKFGLPPKPVDTQYGVLQVPANLLGGCATTWGWMLLVFLVLMAVAAVASVFT